MEARDAADSVNYDAPRTRPVTVAVKALLAAECADDAISEAFQFAGAAFAPADTRYQAGMLTDAANALAAVGRPTDAANLAHAAALAARQMNDVPAQVEVLTDTARVLSTIDLQEDAAELAREAAGLIDRVARLEGQVRLLAEVAVALADAGHPEDGVRLVREAEHRALATFTSPDSVESAEWQHVPDYLTDIAAAAAAMGDLDEAGRIASEAENSARRIINQSPRMHALSEITETLISHRRYEEAERIAHSIVSAFDRTWRLLQISSALASDAQGEAAVRVARIAIQSAGVITDNEHQATAYIKAAGILAACGYWGEAEAIALTLAWPYQRARALTDIAAAFAAAGRLEDAQRIGLIAWLTAIDSPDEHSLSNAAAALTAAGAAEEVANLAAHRVRSLRVTTDLVRGPTLFTRIAAALAAAGQYEDAARLALEVAQEPLPQGSERLQALRTCVQVLIACGRLEEAERTARSIALLSRQTDVSSHAANPLSRGYYAAVFEENDYNKALVEVLDAYIAAGRWDDVWRTSRAITSLWDFVHKPKLVKALAAAQRWPDAERVAYDAHRVGLITDLVRASAAAGHWNEAARMAHDVRRAAEESEKADGPSTVEAVNALAAAGLLEEAETLAREIADPEAQATALITIAQLSIRCSADPDRPRVLPPLKIRSLLCAVLSGHQWLRALPAVVSIATSPAVYERLLDDP